MRAERADRGHAANGEPGLGSAEELVSAERHHVSPLADRGGDGHLGPETVCRGVEQRSAAEVMDVRNPALARQRRELAPFGPSDEPRELEVARVDAKDRAGPLADRARIVTGVGPVRRPDLDQFRARAP